MELPVARTQRWLSLSQAAALLGVDEATLRHWADQGKVQTFRTPGGHRRFLEEDLRALMAPVRPARGDVAATLRRRTLHLVSGLPARRMRAAPWFAALNNSFRAKAREHGRQVVELLAHSLGGTVERREARRRLRLLGQEYGRELRAAGLALSQAVEGYCFFRDLVLARTVQALPPGEAQARTARDLGRLLDEMLLAIVQAYEVPPGQGAP